MTIIANLDAEIEQFYAEQGQTTRELQIFGRVWPLIPAMTSITLAPLMNLQQAAQAAEDGSIDTSDADTRAALFHFLGNANLILSNVIHEDVRPEFQRVIDKKGFPLGILDKVIEAIMQAFDAAPFGSAIPSTPQPERSVPLHVSLSGSGNSSEGAGATSMPTSTPTPATTTPPPSPAPQQPVTSAPAPVVAEWGQEEPTLKAYDPDTALIPPSVRDVPPA